MSELPYRATRVLRAVPVETLHVGLKLLWLEMYALDNGPLGCTASAAYLAARLGYAPRTVEEYRQHLESLGLVRKVSGRRRWHVTMPGDCIPAAERPEEDTVQECARALAAFIRSPVYAVDAATIAPVGVGDNRGPECAKSTVVTVPNLGVHRGMPVHKSPALTVGSGHDPLGQTSAPRPREVGDVGGGWRNQNLQPDVGGLENDDGRLEKTRATQATPVASHDELLAIELQQRLGRKRAAIEEQS